ncbi:serine/threonine-protein kinase PknK [Sorangium cellulosum]|uniref:serine/threonine-protein kinase n=1 Tax=Sorangium cellulosum TaxID=56 RepID=UPI003D9A493A
MRGNDSASIASQAFASTERFRIRGLLGRGGMGVVYRALDVEMGREVALKTLHDVGAGDLYALKEEFRSLAGLVHRNLVELYELFVSGSRCFFTMELLDGTGLLEHVRGIAGAPEVSAMITLPNARQSGSMIAFGAGTEPATMSSSAAAVDRDADCALDDAAYARLGRALWQLSLGLSAVHQAGKLHRDIKPSNLRVTSDGRVVLLDFGLATRWTLEGGTVDDDGPLVGTLPYMAPEQAWGLPLSPAADWYSVGVVLYEALTGRLPFEGSFAAMLRDKERRAAPPPRQLVERTPPALDALTMALLHPEPSRRAGAPDIARALRDLGLVEADATLLALSPAFDGPFLGRDAELAALWGAFEELRHGKARVVQIEGASGIGKTALVRRFLSGIEARGAALARGALVLHGQCRLQESVPYNAFDALVDGLSRALTALDDAEAAALAPRHAGALLRLFPVLHRVDAFARAVAEPLPAEPQELRRQGFGALRELFTSIGRSRPLVLWLDDLQWGDADSALLLGDLLSPAELPPLLLLTSYRSEDIGRSPMLRALSAALAALSAGQASRLAVEPLDDPAARALAAALLGGEALLPEERLARIVVEAAGSPLFLGELARDLAGAAPEGGRAPDAVRFDEVVGRRLSRLSRDERRVMTTVSVAGMPVARSLALRAAGLGEAGRPVVARLAQSCLLRTTVIGEQPAIEPFHDRIRETIVARLPADALREQHRALAETLESAPSPADPEELLRHWLGAGDAQRALGHAIHAADRAAGLLAFVRAAELYGRARELCAGDPALDERLGLRQADALVDAGHGARAAPLYLAFAERAPASAALERRRKAAEQLLVSGHIDRGVEVLRALLDGAGLAYPSTPARALASILARMAHLRARGLGFRERAAEAIAERDLMRIALCQAAAKGLVAVDSVRGGHFSFLSLLLALDAGDPARIGQSLALVGGAVLVPAGGPIGRWGMRMLGEARAIADRRGDAHLLGGVLVASGQAHVFQGAWREALSAADAGIACLRERCRGVAWELNMGHMAGLRALEELGRFAELGARTRAYLREAEGRGDVFAEVTARLYDGVHRAIAGDTAGARAEARAVRRLWSQEGLHVQHLYAHRIDLLSDLHDDRAEAAARAIEEAWPAIARSFLVRIPITRIDARLMRARAALAAASRERAGRPARLTVCERHAGELAREARPDAAAHAALLRAGAAWVRGDGDAAVRRLDETIAGYERAGMAFYAACSRHRKGEILGGDAGRRMRDEAADLMRREGVSSPLRCMAMHAPGW